MYKTTVAQSARAATRVAIGLLALILSAFNARDLVAQQPKKEIAKQRRDSAARADSARRAMRAMRGMKGMTPATPTKSPRSKTKVASPNKPLSTKGSSGAGMNMPMGGAARTGKAPPRGAHSEQQIPVKKDAGGMQAMHHATDSTAAKRTANMPGMNMRDSTTTRRGAMKDSMPGMGGRSDSSMKAMPSMPGMTAQDTSKTMAMVPEPLGVSMERMGSGTTWIPDAVPLPSRHAMAGKWDLMLHGFVFGEYDKQGGPRGQSQAGSLNWGMFMASHELAGGRFQARTMLSLDPWTVTPGGYPLLLQSGESFHGQPLHDRQHPHDFWMELGALYEKAVTRHVGIEAYVAPSGEPALGPVAFMHRPSAMDNPLAPLTHHWQDATHISFGVVTMGLFTHDWKLEGSVFNGREPDENRWDFDPIKLDSYSGRILYNPNTHWALSAGYGFLKSPEALAPLESVHRVTASAIYGTTFGTDGQVATTVVWGANKNSAFRNFSNGALLESEAILDKSNTLIGRAEYVQKSAEDLVLDTPQFGFAPDERFNVSSASLGYIREVARLRGATLGLGAMGTLNMVPSSLANAYGSRTPVGGVVFVRLRPLRSPNTK
ncbi:MAG TPA: hypothetical protein VGP95_21950, partial [Gemmatimonadaceae bacterium]|nr:hypothetical protein [Gemmatimonadaceae bacterium]